jgi:hypothetical protein
MNLLPHFNFSSTELRNLQNGIFPEELWKFLPPLEKLLGDVEDEETLIYHDGPIAIKIKSLLSDQLLFCFNQHTDKDGSIWTVCSAPNINLLEDNKVCVYDYILDNILFIISTSWKAYGQILQVDKDFVLKNHAMYPTPGYYLHFVP